MKIMRVIATLDPRHGGPAAGLRAITPELTKLGHETTFVSLDAPERAALFHVDAPVEALGPARGGYAYSAKLGPWLRQNAGRFDAVFVHGLWQHHGRTVRAALAGSSIPYFVFPHGMLDPWFRQAYPLKHAKKWIYWQLCERHVLREAAAVFFTCEEERRLARGSFHPYTCNERVIAYGTAGPSAQPAEQIAAWRAATPELGTQPFWLFLGRIHPKKGVDLLVRAYGEHATKMAKAPPALVIAGPCADSDYQASLDGMVKTLPAGCRVIWTGMLEGARKWGALRTAEVFILPSHQENFGLAVVESLAVGTPVLISRKVNISAEIESEGAGLVESDDLAGTARLLARWQAKSVLDRAAMRRAAANLFFERYEISRVARSLVQAVTPFLSPLARIDSHEVIPSKETASRVG